MIRCDPIRHLITTHLEAVLGYRVEVWQVSSRWVRELLRAEGFRHIWHGKYEKVFDSGPSAVDFCRRLEKTLKDWGVGVTTVYLPL